MAKIYINGTLIDDIVGDIEVKIDNKSNVGSIGFSYGMVIEGDVTGNANAGMSLDCKNVGKDANAGMGISCGSVTGNANAGMDIRCGSIGGSAKAGMSIKCSCNKK